MFNPFKLLTGGIVESLETVALEFIQTDKESAEAKSLIMKTLDPNGKMRRDLSKFACQAYGWYLISMVAMGVMHTFGIGDPSAAKEAMEFLTKLFTPITASWGAIVTSSFGVNYTNTKLGK